MPDAPEQQPKRNGDAVNPTDILQDQEHERAVAGILLAGVVLPDTLKRDHFNDTACGAVFDAILKLEAQGRPHDLVAVADALKKADQLDGIGGPAFLADLVEHAPIGQHLDYHVEALSVARRRRLLHHVGARLQSAATNAALETSAELETRCAEIMADLSYGSCPAGVVDASQWLEIDLPEPIQVLRGAFDLNTKTCVCGPSKARKSFFLLQAAVSLSGGLPYFLDWKIDQPRTVLHVNLEIPDAHFHRRLKRMATALGITPAQLKGRLFILNARGTPANTVLSRIVAEARRVKAEVVILDPIYKLVPGDESKQENVKALLATMDRICDATGAALVYVHHGTKGESGDRQTIDRAAGSGVLARDVDCLVSLVNHVDDGLLVVEQIARSYAPKDAFTIKWDTEADCFKVEDGVAPTVRTSFNRKRSNGRSITDEDAAALVYEKPLSHNDLMDGLQKKLGMARTPARDTVTRLIESGMVHKFRRKTFPTYTMYGTPEAIEKLMVGS